MKVKLTKIPSAFRRLNLPFDVDICENIFSEEGAVVVVEALTEQGKRNIWESPTGRIGYLMRGDIIPGVLCKRRSSREFSGDIPKELHVGDTLHLIGAAGLVGKILGADPRWGVPMKVKVLGSLVRQGRQLNTKDAAIEWRKDLDTSTPIVAVVSTSMETGKTTTVSKIVNYFKNKGLKVAAAKLTGLAFTEDSMKIMDFGADPVLDFLDGGLPSTCGNPGDVIEMAFGILTEINKSMPDLVVVEFGDSILGEYNVATLLEHPDIQRNIRATIVVASDSVAAWGAKEIMKEYKLPITLITGPVANNQTSALFIQDKLSIPTESNFGGGKMPKTTKLIEKSLGMTIKGN